MKVSYIDNRYNNSALLLSRKSSVVKSPSFTGLFDSPTSEAFKLVQYGIEALDETSLFIATPNKEATNFALNRFGGKIDIPILKTYILEVTKELDADWGRSGQSGFAMFKKNNEYYIMPLNWGMQVSKGNMSVDEAYLQEGDIRRLESGMELRVCSLAWDRKDKLIFERPKRFSTQNAEKYLQVKNTIDSKAHNSVAISILTSQRKDAVNKEKEITFEDIGGLGNVIDDLKKYVIRPLNYPEVFQNVRLNKGILLYGPPRCGKTMLGKALAKEANVSYSYINANEFKQSAVGASEQGIRDTFKKLTAKPSILFIDEFDAIGKKRDGTSNARYDDSVVNQLLGCMSDLEKNHTLSFVIAATNRRDLLDDALIASGRFGLHLDVPMPNLDALEQIYKIHSKNHNFGDDVCVQNLVQMMFENKFNGSDVAEMITNAYFNALERMGLNAKMDARTFTFNDLKSIKISKKDLTESIAQIVKTKV